MAAPRRGAPDPLRLISPCRRRYWAQHLFRQRRARRRLPRRVVTGCYRRCAPGVPHMGLLTIVGGRVFATKPCSLRSRRDSLGTICTRRIGVNPEAGKPSGLTIDRPATRDGLVPQGVKHQAASPQPGAQPIIGYCPIAKYVLGPIRTAALLHYANLSRSASGGGRSPMAGPNGPQGRAMVRLATLKRRQMERTTKPRGVVGVSSASPLSPNLDQLRCRRGSANTPTTMISETCACMVEALGATGAAVAVL